MSPSIAIQHSYRVHSGMGEAIATVDVIVHEDRSHWVTNLWVHPDHRRKGFARALLSAALLDHHAGPLYLHIAPYTDQPMRVDDLYAFYASLGFCRTEVPGVLYRQL